MAGRRRQGAPTWDDPPRSGGGVGQKQLPGQVLDTEWFVHSLHVTLLRDSM